MIWTQYVSVFRVVRPRKRETHLKAGKAGTVASDDRALPLGSSSSVNLTPWNGKVGKPVPLSLATMPTYLRLDASEQRS